MDLSLKKFCLLLSFNWLLSRHCSLAQFKVFYSHKNKKLDAQSISSVNVSTEGSCLGECLYDNKCVAFNTQRHSDTFYSCELLDTDRFQKTGTKLEVKQNYTYFDQHNEPSHPCYPCLNLIPISFEGDPLECDCKMLGSGREVDCLDHLKARRKQNGVYSITVKGGTFGVL